MRYPLCLFVLLVWPIGAPALAQPSRPPAELGVGAGALLVREDDDFLSDGPKGAFLDVRATVPFSPRFSIEAFATVGRDATEFFARTSGLYAFQLKQRLRRGTRAGGHAFVSYGIAGYYERVSQVAVLVPQPDGSVVVSPTFRYATFEQPIAFVVGGGYQHELAPRLSMRADAQLVTVLWLPLGVRLAAGVSIPFGAYR